MKVWVPVPASPLMPVSERLSDVMLPARSKAWLMEPAEPRLMLVGRLASSYARVSVIDDGKACVASRPSRRYERLTLELPTVEFDLASENAHPGIRSPEFQGEAPPVISLLL